MKILVLMKRFGANKDMVLQKRGRQVNLFGCLGERGHAIDFLCADYKRKESKNINEKNIRYFIRPYSLLRHSSFTNTLKKLAQKNQYDFLVSATDPLISILGHSWSRKLGIPHIYDMQDEYSAYTTSRIPLVKTRDKKAVKKAAIVFTVSNSLKKLVQTFRKKPTFTIQNGVDLSIFKKISKKKARSSLSLPKGNIVVYTGEISAFKGVDVLLEAFEIVKKKIPNTYLLLSGKVSGLNIKKQGILFRECSKREEVVMALNAANVGVLPNKEDTFSRYCFPYKSIEYMAVGLPIVATKVGDISAILSTSKNSLCSPDDPQDMAKKIIATLQQKKKKIDYGAIVRELTWKALSGKIEKTLKEEKVNGKGEWLKTLRN